MRGININTSKLKAAAPLILPIVALYLLKFTSGPAPTLARQMFTEHDQATPVRLVVPSEESLRCAQWAAELRAQPCGPSPFYYPQSHAIEEHVEPVVEGSAIARPNVRLDAVMGSDRRLVALINGEFLTIGDPVGTGWTIESIDVRARTVTLAHSTGLRHVLQSR